MKDQILNPVCLKWTYSAGSLSAETFGRPAEGFEMDCAVIVVIDGQIRFERVRGLWDTGTSTTVITPAVAARLGLKPDGKSSMNLNGLGGRQKAWTAVASIGFPNGKAYGPIEVAVHDLPSVDVLIGMDVISLGTLTIEPKPDGGTRFTFTL